MFGIKFPWQHFEKFVLGLVKWKMKSAECGVWKMWSVENAECGKRGVWKIKVYKTES